MRNPQNHENPGESLQRLPISHTSEQIKKASGAFIPNNYMQIFRSQIVSKLRNV